MDKGKFFYRDKGKVVATRHYPDPPGLRSKPSEGHFPTGAPIGQDGYKYVVHGDFSHPFTPHTTLRDSRGELYVGCNWNGSTSCWSEEIHTPPLTHVECDLCKTAVLIDKKIEVEMDESQWVPDVTIDIPTRHDPTDLKTFTIKAHWQNIRCARFFCSTTCLDQWVDSHREPDGQAADCNPA